MQPISPDETHYDRTTIFLHWATAVLVAEQWLGAQTIDWFPGPLRVDARSVHIALGVALTILLLARVIWRLKFGRRLPRATSGGLDVIAKGTHWGLYVLLTAMLLVGLFLAWVRGDSLFNLFRIPSLDPGNRALREEVQQIHATIGYLILALAGLHASAALVHRFLWHDGVLRRMLPRS